MDLESRLLFDITIVHDDDGGQPCAALRVAPSAECAALLARYRLTCRPVPGGARIYRAADDALAPLAGFDEAGPLNFSIVCDDPALPTCSDAGTPAVAGGVFYYDNLAGAQLGLDATSLALSGPRIAYQAAGLPPAPLAVHARLGGAQAWPDPALPLPSPGHADLRDLPDGCYSLLSASAAVRDFYLCHQRHPGLWGVVAIYPGGAAQRAAWPGAAFPIGSAAPLHFRITLGTRSFTWRYVIVGRAGRAAPAGSVTTSDARKDAGKWPAGQFSQVPGTATVNGMPATVYRSAQPLPLLAQPDPLLSYRFQSDGPGMERGCELPLPYAGASQLARDTAGAGQLCADIYVYV